MPTLRRGGRPQLSPLSFFSPIGNHLPPLVLPIAPCVFSYPFHPQYEVHSGILLDLGACFAPEPFSRKQMWRCGFQRTEINSYFSEVCTKLEMQKTSTKSLVYYTKTV